MPGEHQSQDRIPSKRYVQLTLLVWFAMVGIDFFLHGGIFASIYVQKSPFLLPSMEAFRRIPFGYLALLATACLLVWIIGQTSTRDWRKGLVIGFSLGVVMGVSSALGLYSISTASPKLLVAWLIVQVIEMTIAGVIVGYGLFARSLQRLTILVLLGFLLLFVGTIVLQSTGLAPSVRVG